MVSVLERQAFSVVLVGERVSLEMTCDRHTSLVWSYLLRDREKGGRNYSWVESENDVAKYITNKTERSFKEVDRLILFDHQVIGSFHVHSINYDDHKAEIGYAIEKGREGQGFASEALRLVEKEMKRVGFNKLVISCDSGNLRSIQVAERNGFQKEGLLRQDCIENGKFRDSLIFGKLLRSIP